MHGEKGQALPLAILALAIGSLVIVPFLSHAGSSLTGSRVYGGAIDQQSACDAGIEHAIWSLTRGTLAEGFAQPGDEVTYQLDEPLNGWDVTVTVTVTANATSHNGTQGEIADTVIDTLAFDSSNCYLPSLIKVSDNICAVAYRGKSNKGYLKTMSIAASGDIGNSVIDTLTFSNSQCSEPDIVHISGNVYAVAYRGNRDRGYLITVSIAANGVIGNSVIDTLQFDSTGYEPNVIQVSGTTYAIAYRGSSTRGYLKTVSIAANGTIGSSVISTLTFDTSTCYTPSITQASGTTYAIAYTGSGNDGFVKTVAIAPNGQISNSVIDTLEYDTSDSYYPDIIYISGNTYAIAYQGSNNGGFVATVAIASNGQINNSVIDRMEFDDASGQEPRIIHVTGDVYAIAYTGSGNDGFLRTINIAAGGQISDSAIDTLEFDTSDGYYPDIIGVAEGILAIAYSGPSQHGYLKTVGINTSPAAAASWEILATAGATAIQAFVNTENITATIVSWRIE
jgi:hypothetical protein